MGEESQSTTNRQSSVPQQQQEQEEESEGESTGLKTSLIQQSAPDVAGASPTDQSCTGMGGFKLAIELCLPSGVYYTGQTIEGAVVVEAEKEVQLTGLELTFYGGSFFRWTEPQSRRRAGQQEEHVGEEVYFDKSLVLWGSGRKQKDARPETVTKGRHLFPFSWQLPCDVPCSFEGSYGWVRYFAECILFHPCCQPTCNATYNHRRYFTIIRHQDLNTDKNFSKPVREQRDVLLTQPLCKPGRLTCSLRLSRGAFVPGEHVQADVDIQNMTRRKLRATSLVLKQIVKYGNDDKAKTSSWDIATARGDSVKPGKHRCWTTRSLRIPSVVPSELTGCKIMDVKYEIHLTVDLKPHSLTLKAPVIIGTISNSESYLVTWVHKDTVTEKPHKKVKTRSSMPASTSVSSGIMTHTGQEDRVPYLPRYRVYKADQPGATMLSLEDSPGARRRESVWIQHDASAMQESQV